MNHLFYECSFTNLVCNDCASFWSLVSGKGVDLTLQDMLLSKLDEEIEILLYFTYYFTLLDKLHIWLSWKHGVIPNLSRQSEI